MWNNGGVWVGTAGSSDARRHHSLGSLVLHSPSFHGSVVCPLFTIIVEHLHEYEGVKYVPVTVTRELEREWISAEWLSKQVKCLRLEQKKPSDIGLPAVSGESG